MTGCTECMLYRRGFVEPVLKPQSAADGRVYIGVQCREAGPPEPCSAGLRHGACSRRAPQAAASDDGDDPEDRRDDGSPNRGGEVAGSFAAHRRGGGGEHHRTAGRRGGARRGGAAGVVGVLVPPRRGDALDGARGARPRRHPAPRVALRRRLRVRPGAAAAAAAPLLIQCAAL